MDYAVKFVAINLGERLLKQTAALLPKLFDSLREKLLEIVNKRSIKVTQALPCHAWLRSQLSFLLKHHVAYKCSVPRIGTVTYRFGGDIYHALSVALSNDNASSVRATSDKETMAEVCQTLNRRCHTQINKLIEEDTMRPHCIENIDLNAFIEQLDPDIWKAVCLLMQPSSTRANRKENSHVRKLRQVFCVCSIFFTMNRQCSFPIHTLIADAIKTLGGSNKLVRVLNRLGVCASSETHTRYIQY